MKNPFKSATSQQLFNVARLLDAGWIQGVYASRGRYCMVGAARAIDGNCTLTEDALARYAVDGRVIDLNDRQCKTKEDAVSFVLQVAAAEDCYED